MNLESLPKDFNWYSDNGIFLPMINDTGRNIFYNEAIKQSVAGKTVCDIGAGTGFLSILAAQHGASHVYAVEMDSGRAQLVRNMISHLNLQDKITVINDNFLNLDLKADIYVSETIGWHIFNEDILHIARHAQKHGGTFIPGTFKIKLVFYHNHPIFTVCMRESEAYDFKPDIDIDPAFQDAISQIVTSNTAVSTVRNRINSIANLFTMYKNNSDMKQLRLNTFYETPELVVDLNKPIPEQVEFLVKTADIHYKKDMMIAMFWTAYSGDVAMDLLDTWWAVPCKIILNATQDIHVWYDDQTKSWILNY